MNDLKFAFRQLLKNPGFTAVAVLTLALGIGANVAVFSLVNTFHFVRLPVREPDQLLAVLVPETGNVFSEASYQALSEHTNALTGFAAFAQTSLVTRHGDQPARRNLEYVTPNYFGFLGVEAAMGRTLSESDRGIPHIVISDRWWEREFRRNPNVIGQGVEIQGMTFTIIGVGPPGFVGMVPVQPAAGWISREFERSLGLSGEVSYGDRWLRILGRLRPGISIGAATEALRAMEGEVLEPWMIEEQRHLELVACGRGLMPPEQRREAAVATLLASAVMGLVLCIAATNLAGLLLSRGVNRRRVFSIQCAMGATRARIARQLFLESLLLAMAGGGLGLLFSNWGMRGLILLVPRMAGIEVEFPPAVNGLAFTLVLSLLAALFVGLAPALLFARADFHGVLKNETLGLSGSNRWYDARNVLVVSQVAVCVVLLIATGLVWRSLYNRRSFDTGFDSSNVLVASLWEREQSVNPSVHSESLEELRRTLNHLPGVRSASLVTHAPMGLQVSMAQVSNDRSEPREWHTVTMNSVSSEFFPTLGVPLLAGRDFTEEDRRGGIPVAIVSRRLAEALYPGTVPLGQHVYHAGKPHEVVGVVGEVRFMRFESPHIAGTLYLSAGQHPYADSPNLLVRTDQVSGTLQTAVTSMIRQADPGQQRPWMRSYEQYMDEVLTPERSAIRLLGLAGLTGLGLACLGLYGVISYHAARRTREIGIRMALGAHRDQVLLLILRRGLMLTGSGIVIGCGVALGTSKFVGPLLYGVGPADPLTYASVALVLVLLAALACWLPARRAAKIDPLEALRAE